MIRRAGYQELLKRLCLEALARQYKPRRILLVGGQGIPLEEFLSKPAAHWLD